MFGRNPSRPWLAPLLTASLLFNALSQQTWKNFGFTDFTSASDAALLNTTIANLSVAQKATLAARGVSLPPYSNFPATQTVRQALLPYTQYTGLLNPVGGPLGKNWYDSLRSSSPSALATG